VPRFVVVGIAALIAVANAAAAGEPEVFAAARVGHLDVVSSVIVSPMSVDMLGGWVDETHPCRETRLLDVKALIDFIPAAGPQKRVNRKSTTRTENCSEGGPNMGFTLKAKALGLACPNGRWKPGRYQFVTTTLEHRVRLRAVASVGWNNSTPC
jgi:hypothetical protein